MFYKPIYKIISEELVYLQKKLKKFRLVLILLSLLCSCTPDPVRQELRRLDEAIAQKDFFLQSFERRNDTLRALLSEASDSAKWKRAEALYQAYRHFSADSAGRYVTLMQHYAATPKEEFLTRLSEIQLLVWSHDEARALIQYEAIDTTGIESMGLMLPYLSRGIEVYANISRFPRFLSQQKDYPDSLQDFRQQYISRDTVSLYGKKILAQQLRDEGRTREALDILLRSIELARGSRQDLLSLEYNTGILYGQMGDPVREKIHLARSAVEDFRAANRDFLSLYELSLALFHDGDIKRASRYIQIHFADVLAGDFQAKFIRSSQAQDVIVKASEKVERSRQIMLIISIVILSLLLAWSVMLSRMYLRQSRILEQVNKTLEEKNHALAEVNKIKDGYVFTYMDLSVKHLDMSEEYRHSLLQTAKKQGTEALMKELRQPIEFTSYKQFYQIFDQTFLGIFPNFVEDVNALLRKEARFDVSGSKRTMPTELRILAIIKLGLEDSPSIAAFLKCSLSTVYTYRAKMRNRAICPKEEFEERIKALGYT